MNKTQTKKLTKYITNYGKTEAMLSALQEGMVISPEGAKAAGIADPRRAVNRLRERGHNIVTDVTVTKKGTARAYRFVAPRARKSRSAR